MIYQQTYNSISFIDDKGLHCHVVKDVKKGDKTIHTIPKFDFSKTLSFARCREILAKIREFMGDATISNFQASLSVWEVEVADEQEIEAIKNNPFIAEHDVDWLVAEDYVSFKDDKKDMMCLHTDKLETAFFNKQAQDFPDLFNDDFEE